MEIHKLDFWTSYNQFFLADESTPWKADSDDFWTTEAFNDRLAIEEGILGVGTQCFGSVKGDLAVLEAEPQDEDLHSYDHVVEGSLDLKSGVLQVIACTDNESSLELTLPPQAYRVRVYSSNLASVVEDDGDDYYKIRLWPAKFEDRKVLKRWHVG